MESFLDRICKTKKIEIAARNLQKIVEKDEKSERNHLIGCCFEEVFIVFASRRLSYPQVKLRESANLSWSLNPVKRLSLLESS